jgi:hypothetical protein
MTPFAIDKVLADARLLGAALGDIKTWAMWVIALKAAFALPLTDAERKTFATVAGDRVSKVVFDYVLGFMRASEVLAKEIESTTRSEIRLKNGIAIAVHPNSFRSVRGRTLCAAVFDETAYWRDDSTATPDSETYTAVLPALSTTGGMLVSISSPYRRAGLLHTKHKRYFGTDSDDTLVVQGTSKQFNGTLNDAAIAAQQEADPTAARSEWDAQFRDDIAGFLDDALIERAIDHDRPIELPPRPDLFYRAYVDSSGGAVGGDAYTLAIAHKEADTFIIDAIRGRAGPFDPEELTQEYAALCKDYRVTGVTGDKYAREWVASAWRKCSLPYAPATLTASETYLEALPLWTRGAVRIPDHPTLLRELRLLERVPARLGKVQVTHPRGVHDDYANVCFGALQALVGGKYRYDCTMSWVSGPSGPDDNAAEDFLRQRFQAHLRGRRW